MNTTATVATKTITGYLIRPLTKTVHEIVLPDGNSHLASMYAALDCSCVDVVRLLPTEDCWIDDEGLFREGDEDFAKFAIMQPGVGWRELCGNALILGREGPETVSSKLTAESLLANVAFFDCRAEGDEAIRANITRPTTLGPRVVVDEAGCVS
jgi:hypothetical protein